MKTKQADAMKHPSHPESPQHEPVPVDTDHAELVQAHGAIAHEFTKPQVVRKHEQGEGEPDKGGEDKRSVKASQATLGRHITSDPGTKVAYRRQRYVKTTRATREKVNFGSKK